MTRTELSCRAQRSEAALQSDVRTLLTLEKVLWYEFAPPGSRARCPRCGVVVGALGGANPPGWSDMLVILPPGDVDWPPVYIHLELKVGAGTLSADQIDWRNEIVGVGGYWHEIRRIEDMFDVLTTYGHRMRMGGP